MRPVATVRLPTYPVSMAENDFAHPPADAFDRFAEQLGRMTEEGGLPRNAGRIFGLLLLSGEPLSFGLIAKKLEASRGGVSDNTRLLQKMGLIERHVRSGDRQDYFVVPKDVWQRQLKRQLHRDEDALKQVETLLSSTGELPAEAFKRLSNLAWMLRRSTSHCTEAIAMLDNEEGC